MRAVGRARYFPAAPPELVPAAVRMSRCHFAQLAQQRWAPPKAWAAAMPGASGADASSPYEAKAADVGLKLIAGFEILCARARVELPPPAPQAGASQGQEGASSVAASAPTAAQAPGLGASASSGQPQPQPVGFGATPQAGAEAPTVPEADVASNPAWRTFKAALVQKGFFAGNVPGSARCVCMRLGATDCGLLVVVAQGRLWRLQSWLKACGPRRVQSVHEAAMMLQLARKQQRLEGRKGT